MKTTEIKGKFGTSVLISMEGDTVVCARLYVNNGETACRQTFSGKTLKGAEKWAQKVLAAHDERAAVYA